MIRLSIQTLRFTQISKKSWDGGLSDCFEARAKHKFDIAIFPCSKDLPLQSFFKKVLKF
jgi:hypothetical protein